MQEIRRYISIIGAERSLLLLAGVKTATANNNDSMLLTSYIAIVIEEKFSHRSRDTQLLASLMFTRKQRLAEEGSSKLKLGKGNLA